MNSFLFIGSSEKHPQPATCEGLADNFFCNPRWKQTFLHFGLAGSFHSSSGAENCKNI
jgi:hypothetical protein